MPDFNYDLTSIDPVQRQQLIANMLRQQQQSAQMVEANKQGHAMDDTAAIAKMANNPAAAAAADYSAQNRQKQYKPDQLGNTGFALPATGEFVESPMWRQDREAARDNTRAIAEGNQILRKTIADNLNQTRLSIAETKATGGNDRNVQRYSQIMDKSGAADLEGALTQAEDLMRRYPTGQLPGFGRFLSAVPTGLMPQEHQLARSDMATAANRILAVRSGLAVTDSEQRRFLEEIARGAGMSENAMRHGWANIRNTFNQKLQNLTSGFTPDVHKSYLENGGRDYRHPQSPDYEAPESVTRPNARPRGTPAPAASGDFEVINVRPAGGR